MSLVPRPPLEQQKLAKDLARPFFPAAMRVGCPWTTMCYWQWLWEGWPGTSPCTHLPLWMEFRERAVKVMVRAKRGDPDPRG